MKSRFTSLGCDEIVDIVGDAFSCTVVRCGKTKRCQKCKEEEAKK